MLIGSPKNAGLRVSHLMELTENKIQLLKK